MPVECTASGRPVGASGESAGDGAGSGDRPVLQGADVGCPRGGAIRGGPTAVRRGGAAGTGLRPTRPCPRGAGALPGRRRDGGHRRDNSRRSFRGRSLTNDGEDPSALAAAGAEGVGSAAESTPDDRGPGPPRQYSLCHYRAAKGDWLRGGRARAFRCPFVSHTPAPRRLRPGPRMRRHAPARAGKRIGRWHGAAWIIALRCGPCPGRRPGGRRWRHTAASRMAAARG